MAKDSDIKEISPADETILDERVKGSVKKEKYTIVDTQPSPTGPPEEPPPEDD